MILWINGSFGSGKTSTAFALNKKIENSYVYDPEEAGFYIRDNIPPSMKLEDFQDFKMWRDINYTVLSEIDKTYDGLIIVPMTLVNETYYDEIINSLRIKGHEVRHFSLRAKKDTLMNRLHARGDKENPWILERIDYCVKQLEKPMFEEGIVTDEMSVNEIVDYIIEACQLS